MNGNGELKTIGSDSGDTPVRRRGPPRSAVCNRGHLRALTTNRFGHCKECRNIRERDQRAAMRDRS